ncbi:glyoxalase [Chitinophaga parva]|uniref:Glyoxalase n=1 Tax=Chitinophaga parva TaxID=2169414 RepID=A0A2T7BHE1_9BACT|nr:VOC family protein [Chitinophaga parva]PUZ25692.1 glyoxalase [Chitinophaga parva]
MQSLSPNLFVRDIHQSIAFYEQLGFEKVMSVPESTPYHWVMLASGPVTIMLQTLESLGRDLPEIQRDKTGGSLLLYIKRDEVTHFFETIKSRVTVLKGLEKTFYGATEFTIIDTDGYVLTFAADE